MAQAPWSHVIPKGNAAKGRMLEALLSQRAAAPAMFLPPPPPAQPPVAATAATLERPKQPEWTCNRCKTTNWLSRKACRDCGSSRSPGKSKPKERRRTRNPSRETRKKDPKEAERQSTSSAMDLEDDNSDDDAWSTMSHAQLKQELQSTELILKQLKDKDAPRAVSELSDRLASIRKALRDKMPDGQRMQHLTSALKKQDKYTESRRLLISDLTSQLAEAQAALSESESKEAELQKEVAALKTQFASDTVLDSPPGVVLTPTQVDMAVAVSVQDLQKQLLTSPKAEDIMTAVQSAMQSFASRLLPDLLPSKEGPAAEEPTQAATAAELQQAGAPVGPQPPDHYGACDKMPADTPGPYAKAAAAKPKGLPSA